MSPQLEITIIDRVKTADFPVLLGIVSVFMFKFYNNQDEITHTLMEIKNETIKINGVTNIHEYRLDELQRQCDKNSQKIEDIQQKKNNK